MLMGSLCKPPFQLPGIGGLSLRAGNTRFGRPVSANPSFRVSSTRPSCRARAGQAKVAAVAKTSAKPKKQEEPGFDTDNVNFVEDYRAVKVATFRVVSKEDKAKLDGAHKHLFAADGFEDFGSWLEQLGDVQTSHHRCVGRRGAAKQTAKASVGTSVESVVEGDTAASERGECEGASSIGRATRGVKGLVFGAGRPSMIGGTSAACQSGRKSPERSGEGDAGQFRTAPTMGASESRLFKYASEGGRSGRGELVGATSKRSDSDIGEIDSTSDSAWKQYAPRRGVGASAGQRGGAERGAGSSSGGRGEKEFGLQGEADVLTGGTGRAVLAGGMGEAECAEGKTEPLSRRKFQGESSGVGSGSGGGALPRKNSEADSMTEQRAPKKRGRPPKQGKDVGVSRGAEAAASSEGIGEAIPSGGVRLVASLRGNAGAGFSGRLEAESWSKARDRSRREGAYTDEGLRPIVAMKDRDLGAEDVSSVGKNEGAWSINEYLAGGLKSRNNGLPSEEPVRQPRKRGRKPGTKKASVVPVDGFQHCRVSDTANVSRTEQSQVEAAVDRGARCSGDGAVLRSEDRTQDKSVQNDGAGSGRGENEGRGGELWERIGEPFETLQAGHRIQDDTALGGFSVSGKRDSLVDSGSVAAETVGMTGLPKQGPASQLGPAAEAVQMGRRIRTDRKPAVSEADDPFKDHPLRLRQKRCERCEQQKELADYTRTVSTADGFNPFCRACHAAINAGRRGKILPQESMDGRVCSDCKRFRPALEFALRPTGLKLRCRACDSLKQADYRARVEQRRLEISHQECGHCHETKPIGEFSRHKGLKTGHDTYCKKCQRVRYLAWKADRKPLPTPIVKEKKCARCEETKPAREYARSVTNFDGLQTLCRPCVLLVRKEGGAGREGAAEASDDETNG